MSKEEISKKGAAVGECLLNNSMFFAVGLVAGSFLSVRRKNVRPFVVAVGMGTAGDMVFGYCYSCRQLINEYELAKQHQRGLLSTSEQADGK